MVCTGTPYELELIHPTAPSILSESDVSSHSSEAHLASSPASLFLPQQLV